MGFEVCYAVTTSCVSCLGKISLLRTSALAIWTVESFCELAMGHWIMQERKSIRGKVICSNALPFLLLFFQGKGRVFDAVFISSLLYEGIVKL